MPLIAMYGKTLHSMRTTCYKDTDIVCLHEHLKLMQCDPPGLVIDRFIEPIHKEQKPLVFDGSLYQWREPFLVPLAEP